METKGQEIARLQSEIATRQSRLQLLVLGDPRKSFEGRAEKEFPIWDIIVNGGKTHAYKKWLDYEDVLLIASVEPGKKVMDGATVCYRQKGGQLHSIYPGESIEIEDGMIFDCAVTDAT